MLVLRAIESFALRMKERNETKEFYNKGIKMKSKNGQSVLGVIGIIVIVVVVILAWWALHFVLYPAEQATKIYDKTLEADNVIYNYEYFKQAYQDIKAMDQKIQTAKDALKSFLETAGPRDKWDFRDKEESARLSANVTGLANVRNEMVATYNGRGKMANRSIFMGKDVPASIE